MKSPTLLDRLRLLAYIGSAEAAGQLNCWLAPLQAGCAPFALRMPPV